SSLELFFEPENRDSGVAYFSRGEHFQFTVTATGVEMLLCNVSVNTPANPHELHVPGNLYSVSARRLLLELKGANVEAVPSGTGLLRGKMNYLIGSDEQQWRTAVPTYSRVLV